MSRVPIDNPSHINQRLLKDVIVDVPAAPAEGSWPTQVAFYTQRRRGEALELAAEAAEGMRAGRAPGHQLIILEHPPTIEGIGGAEPTAVEASGIPVEHRAADHAELFLPGQLHFYLTIHSDHLDAGVEDAGKAAARVLLETLSQFGMAATADAEAPETPEAPESREGRIEIVFGEAVIGVVRVRREDDAPRVVQIHATLETNTDLEVHRRLAGGAGRSITSMVAEGMPVERQEAVRIAVLTNFEEVFGSRSMIPQQEAMRASKPPWLRARLPISIRTQPVQDIIGDHGLNTVCASARCPNQGECWEHGTATFMINGNVCTRSCSFCAIHTGRPETMDANEPKRVAEAARKLGLDYVVVTSVNRDELPDGGAGAFGATIRELRAALPGARVEVLIPDFKGNPEALATVFGERPDVLNHNMETVPRLYRRVRPQARYQQSLDVIRAARGAGLVTKSGFMLGLGEEEGEIEALLRDLHAHGCQIVTIGQYLRPSAKHHPVVRYAPPSEFEHWKRFGLELGFQTVQSGPLVRSSYHAHESFESQAAAAEA